MFEGKKYGERVIDYRLKNGLKVTFIEAKHSLKSHVELVVKFGSKHDIYVAKEKTYQITPGSAHFIEHLVFTKDDQDLFDRFYDALMDVNAQTGYEHTSYFFQISKLKPMHLKHLFELVSPRFFSKAQVEKEKRVILHEFTSYESDIDEHFSMSLKNHLFKEQSYGFDILGTKTSISQMDHEKLNQIFKAAYQPNQMHLFITASTFDETLLDEIMSFDFNHDPLYQVKSTPMKHVNQFDKSVKVKDFYHEKLAYTHVFLTKFDYHTHLYLHLYAYLTLNPSLKFHEKLVKSSLVDTFFECHYQFYQNFSYMFFLVETKNSKKILKRLNQHLNNHIIEEQSFNETKQLFYFKLLKMLDQPDLKHELSVTLSVLNLNIIDVINIYESLNFKTFKQVIEQHHFSKGISYIYHS